MGTVYEAVHTVLPRRAAIKVMNGELRRQPGMATRMVQEASILEEVRHPGVVRVYECNLLDDRRPWIAMEFVDGETLAARLHYMQTLPAVEVATLLAEICDVLAAVHARGVVHRDLKPDNLLLTPTDRDFPLRVIDWGVARLGPHGRLTLEGLTPGTPIYMAPEQATGKNIGAPCDVYALGVIAYEALSGHPPFDGRTLAEVVCMHMASDPAPLREQCDAPERLCDLVHRMLDKDPSLRPGALEIRQLARSVSLDLSASAYEEVLITHEAPPRPASRPALSRLGPRRGISVPSDEVSLVDPDELELGITELLPIVRKPRWTPEIGPIPGALATQPTALHAQAAPLASEEGELTEAGEVVLPDRRHRSVS